MLKKEFSLTLYFYNPNIHPEEEYRLRLGEVEKLAALEKLPLITGDYLPDKWMEMTAPHSDEPEKGMRCQICIGDRLAETARQAAKMDIKNFGTVLSVSPHKDAVMINRAGKAAEKLLEKADSAVAFYEANFKKKEGFKISSRISKELGFKRQDYCGCVYSRKQRWKRKISAN